MFVMRVSKHVKPTGQNKTPDDMKFYRRKRIKLEAKMDRPVDKHKEEGGSCLFGTTPLTNAVADSEFEVTMCNVCLHFA